MFNKATFIFGFYDANGENSKIDNTIILIIKQYIYKCRCLSIPLNILALKNTIKDYYKVQKYIAIGKGDTGLDKFTKEWSKWIILMDAI